MVRVINELSFQADIVFPGISEARQLTGQETPEAMAAFYHRQGVPKVVIKLGTKGAYASFDGEAAVLYAGLSGGKGGGYGRRWETALLSVLSAACWKVLLRRKQYGRGAAIGALAVMSPGDNDGLPG